MPALGPVAVARRMTEAGDRLLAALLGDTDAVGDPVRAGPRRQRLATARRAQELGARVNPQGSGIGLLAGVIGGNLRLLLGMLRTNRPWRLAVRLSRLLVGAFATAVLALVSADIWQLSAALGNLRSPCSRPASVLAVVLTMVLGARLWERSPPGPRAREQVVLFNVVTVLTVVIGVLALYAALAALTIIGAIALVPWDLLSESTGRPAGIAHQVKLGWLASSLATVGGALGAGLESDSAVREAAYRYRPDAELNGEKGRPDPADGARPGPGGESGSLCRDASESERNHEAGRIALVGAVFRSHAARRPLPRRLIAAFVVGVALGGFGVSQLRDPRVISGSVAPWLASRWALPQSADSWKCSLQGSVPLPGYLALANADPGADDRRGVLEEEAGRT